MEKANAVKCSLDHTSLSSDIVWGKSLCSRWTVPLFPLILSGVNRYVPVGLYLHFFLIPEVLLLNCDWYAALALLPVLLLLLLCVSCFVVLIISDKRGNVKHYFEKNIKNIFRTVNR